MAVEFPAIKPVSRTFTPGVWPVTRSEAQNGVVSFREWGDLASGAQLNLSFDNKLDSPTASLLRCYRDSRGGYVPGGLILPPELFSGIGPLLQEVVDEEIEGLTWRFAGPSDFRAVPPSLTTVPVQLVGELRFD